MGVISNYMCDDCRFKISIDMRSFYYDCDLKETIDYAIGPLTRNMGKNTIIDGYVKKTYCGNCKKFVKIYIICKKAKFENICEIVEKGIHKYLNNKLIELDKLKKIKKREKYVIEKKIYNPTHKSYYQVTFPELKEEYTFPGCPVDTKNEVIKQALEHFHKKIDFEIEYCQETCKENNATNYIVLDYSDDIPVEYNPLEKITCPQCHVKINKYINEKIPCPKCKGKISLAGILGT